MLKFYNYDIVFQEIPDEITLAINLTMCPIHCKGCHSKFLWEDIGEVLDESAITDLVNIYKEEITCVALMGGDNDTKEVNRLMKYVKEYFHLRTAWYTGREKISNEVDIKNFDYIKVGPYIEELGGLKSKRTNQKLLLIKENGDKEDITYRINTK